MLGFSIFQTKSADGFFEKHLKINMGIFNTRTVIVPVSSFSSIFLASFCEAINPII